MLARDRIADLERRQQILENEIAEALATVSTNDPMVVELRSRVLYLRDEINRLRQKASRQLH
jgi:hypothetical protein